MIETRKRRIPRYEFNRNFFKRINSKNSYVAGVIATDGCISDSTKSKTLKISWKLDDKEQLQKIATLLGYTGPVNQSLEVGSGYNTKFSSCTLSISGLYEVANDLERNFSITPRKTFTLKRPNINRLQNKLAYIIGFIDGDGSMGIWKQAERKSVKLEMLGTEDVLTFIAETFDEIVPSPLGKTNLTNSKHIPALKVSGRRAEEIIKILLQVPVPRLARKWDKFNYLLEGKYLHSDRFYKTCQTTVQ